MVQVTLTAFRTDPETARKLRKVASATGLSLNQVVNAAVQHMLRDPEALTASLSYELTWSALTEDADR
jgi:hypothetical protein